MGAKSNLDLRTQLLTLLAHPNIASKHWIIRQYDHEVQGGSVIKPLTGPLQIGPSDASVIRPKLDSYKGVVVSCGMSPQIEDAYSMAIASIDEAIRNAVAIGADPTKLAILDNFCWPSVDDERTMGTLVAACEACYDASMAYGIPFISGKDSLHNQFTNQETGQVLKIPNTLLISAIGVIEDVRKCVTMDLKGGRDSVVARLNREARNCPILPVPIARWRRSFATVTCKAVTISLMVACSSPLLRCASRPGWGCRWTLKRSMIRLANRLVGISLRSMHRVKTRCVRPWRAAGVELVVLGKVTALPRRWRSGG